MSKCDIPVHHKTHIKGLLETYAASQNGENNQMVLEYLLRAKLDTDFHLSKADTFPEKASAENYCKRLDFFYLAFRFF